MGGPINVYFTNRTWKISAARPCGKLSVTTHTFQMTCKCFPVLWSQIPVLTATQWWCPHSGGCRVSLQYCLFDNPSFFVNGKVVILWIVQSFFYALIQVLQGDEVLCILLLKIKRIKSAIKLLWSEFRQIFPLYSGRGTEGWENPTCNCKISLSFSWINSCCCRSRCMIASNCLRSASSFSSWILRILWNTEEKMSYCFDTRTKQSTVFSSMVSLFLPEIQYADVLLVVPGHEGAMLLCLLPRPLLRQGARPLLVLPSEHLFFKLQTDKHIF